MRQRVSNAGRGAPPARRDRYIYRAVLRASPLSVVPPPHARCTAASLPLGLFFACWILALGSWLAVAVPLLLRLLCLCLCLYPSCVLSVFFLIMAPPTPLRFCVLLASALPPSRRCFVFCPISRSTPQQKKAAPGAVETRYLLADLARQRRGGLVRLCQRRLHHRPSIRKQRGGALH
jgi:hypothetical protein